MKKNKIILISIISVILLILILGILFYLGIFSQVISRSSFYDKTLGLIETKLIKGSEPVKQAFFSYPLSVKVGTKTTINSYVDKLITDCKLFTPYSWKINIKKNGKTISTIDISKKITCGFGGTIQTSFTPTEAGEYTAEDVYSYLTGITIGSPEVKIFSARNTLIVVAEQIQICSKLPYFGGWYTIEEINGGVIQERIFYDVTTSCSFKEDHKESRIVCNEGYIVSGTSSRISTDNFRTCESITPEIEEIQDPECNEDLIETCSDETEVTTQYCSDGFFVDTGNICSVVEIPEKIENETIEEITQPTEEKITESFWNQESITGIKNLYLIIILSSVVVLFIFVVTMIIIFSKRKK